MADDLNRVMLDRRKKLDGLRAAGINPFANGFVPDRSLAAVLTSPDAAEAPAMPDLLDDAPHVVVCGRVMAKNKMGKATFMRLRDGSVGVDPSGPQNLQIYLRKDVMDADDYVFWRREVDIGDIIGIRGPLFRTRTGELTVMVHHLELLTKSLRPLPDKHAGLTDVETRYRQRYVDLIMNPVARATFKIRSQIIAHIRRLLESRGFIEVETPMMHPIPGGATARPFETFHNALAVPLYLRVAPELYLKRLVVGGLERVFEVNRNFRNEGLSLKHNPEFTMLEFYQAYATYEDALELTEEMLSTLALALNAAEGREGETTRPYGDHVIDYKRPFARYTMRESLVALGGLTEEQAGDTSYLLSVIATRGPALPESTPYGKVLAEAFELLVEDTLIEPTFITGFPTEVSPLARRSESDPGYVDRFELFVGKMEIANAFSELNDPIDQRARFEAQVAQREGGDQEAMHLDADYIRALEYGMPPTAGEGVGIDRLAMLMANQQSIREVIFFPHMRPE